MKWVENNPCTTIIYYFEIMTFPGITFYGWVAMMMVPSRPLFFWCKWKYHKTRELTTSVPIKYSIGIFAIFVGFVGVLILFFVVQTVKESLINFEEKCINIPPNLFLIINIPPNLVSKIVLLFSPSIIILFWVRALVWQKQKRNIIYILGKD